MTVTSVGDNPQVPSMVSMQYVPDQLIAGDLKVVTGIGTIAAGALPRGTVLGIVTTTGSYIKSVKTANDGSQVPCAVLVDFIDATAAPVAGAPLYLTGEFNVNSLTFDASWNAATLTAALRALNIFLKTPVSAADPT